VDAHTDDGLGIAIARILEPFGIERDVGARWVGVRIV